MTSAPLQPIGLSLTAAHQLRIQWSDGQVRIYSPGELRAACPCAGCATQRQPAVQPDSSRLQANPDVCIEEMSPVGNYAYKIVFSDGHSTGIYLLELLRALGQAEA